MSVELPNTSQLYILGFVLICILGNFGNICFYVRHEPKWFQFKMKKRNVEFFKGFIFLPVVCHNSVVTLFI